VLQKKNLAPGIITPSYASGQVLNSGTLASFPTGCIAPVRHPLAPPIQLPHPTRDRGRA
jgi:hypothetical protein